MRHVALAVGQLGLGGTEGQVVALARGLKERGVEVAVASLFGGGPRQADLEAHGIPVYLGGFPAIRASSASGPAATSSERPRALAPPRVATRLAMAFARYTRWLGGFGPDLVHAFLFHAYVLTPPAARLARVPVVVAGRRSLGLFKDGRPWLLGFERVATSMTDLVVANSSAVALDVLRQERLEPDKLTVLSNGIAATAFRSYPPAVLPRTGALVVCVANLLEYKGHRYLLDAAHRLAGRGTPVTVALAGDGPLRGALEDQAAAGDARVLFLGQRTDIQALLAAADVVALPSLEEGCSNSLLEGMAAGRPIVATDVGGNAEALASSGVLVPPRDAEALAAAIGRLLRSPHEAARLGAAAKTRALLHFSERAMVDRHLRLYDSLVARCAG